MNKICIAGMGPGALEYITPAALEAIIRSDILVGGKRNLDSFQHLNKEVYEFKSSMEDMFNYVQEARQEKKICVVVSGDPGFYSLLDFFLKKLGRDSLEVIPGISSFQYLFAKLAKPWKNFFLCSMHGRDTDMKEKLAEKDGLFLLTDRTNNPNMIADFLISQDLGPCTITVGENLSYADERIVVGRPEEIRNLSFGDLCVVVIEKDGMEL
ncbi:precorrin-6y C5,15-methyltransferase (decarboxylating) subunit CbiE [Candidatus Formimonas warabiya]|uniref:Precorrin-6y C5,15-methyltransferase (Decarboxylating) subunit CbiE n=1 Tax=Formimonas warabiya TaxID=1761012 RepID=A0A3G1L014_FORW1|nr:precorrin-6y C5,15-methyltransferase (decarboxylating) subunit CbiE [Candidatus Formimonas warabiya]ATW28126.1 precorrin-6y C5,15-methyltransferase (decarboxylating) subunit CbiE [Candidatus Formimonas warabiya]